VIATTENIGAHDGGLTGEPTVDARGWTIAIVCVCVWGGGLIAACARAKWARARVYY
jgi:hypothetical protein